MTEKEEELVQKWQERYDAYYRHRPGCFPGRLDPKIMNLNLERREMLLGFQTGEWMVNPMGNVHGGILASMADTAAGMLCKALLDLWDGAPTVHLSVNYLRPVALDREVHVRAVCDKPGRFLNYFTCAAFYPERPEELLFTSECIYFAAAGRVI